MIENNQATNRSIIVANNAEFHHSNNAKEKIVCQNDAKIFTAYLLQLNPIKNERIL